MQAAIITGANQLELQSFPDPDPIGTQGIVVEIRYCGICGTDVHAWQHGGAYPAALCGHEWGGVVSKAASEVTRVREGDRVCVSVLPPCGACAECRAGHEHWCVTAMSSLGGGDPCGSRHGGFAPSIAVSEARVAPVPDAMSDEAAAQVEPATVAYHGVRRSGLRLGDYTVVQGAGPIGLFTLQWARAAGAGELIVIEGSPVRAELARSLGATRVCAPGEEAAELVREGTGGLGADVVFECVGRPETIQTAIGLARRGGALMIIGLSDRDASITPGILLSKELRVDASIAYHHTEFERAIAMIVDGRVRADLSTRKVGFAGLEDAIAELAAGDAKDAKILFDPRAD
jgi:(R,R)-butanediol dehydrogenase/meso-butanediol dehydrogenase/diacetyl reductase